MLILFNSNLQLNVVFVPFASASVRTSLAFLSNRSMPTVQSVGLLSRRGVLPGVAFDTAFFSSATPFPEDMVLELGQPIPRVFKPYHFTLPSIHSDNFFDALEELLTKLHYDPQEKFSIILQPILSNGRRRTLGHSFNTNIQPKMDTLKTWL